MQNQLVPVQNVNIASQIVQLSGRPAAMLDKDVADIYGVKTRQINQAVKRNPEKFSEPDFCFTPTTEERSQIVTRLKIQTHTVPSTARLFTRAGVNMLGTCLNSPEAVARTKVIIEAFTALESGQLPQLSAADVRSIVRESLAEAVPEIVRESITEALKESQKKVSEQLDEIGGLTSRERALLWAPIKTALSTIPDRKTRRSYEALTRNMLISRAGGRYRNVSPQQKDDLFLFAEQIAKLLIAPATSTQQQFVFGG